MSQMLNLEEQDGCDVDPTCAGACMKLSAQIRLSSSELEELQQLMNASFSALDAIRKSPVPHRLVLDRGFRIQNCKLWKEYSARLQSVRSHLTRLRRDGSTGFCSRGHTLLPCSSSRYDAWVCSGHREPGGCQSGISDLRKIRALNRFSCSFCQLDYCEKCYLLRTGSKLCHKGHAFVPLRSSSDKGWECAGQSKSGDCLSVFATDVETKGYNGFRCLDCKYDLCVRCYQYHVGRASGCIPEVKSGSILSEECYDLDADANCMWLFHGTSPEAGQSICAGNLLINNGSKGGKLYGRGIYLAEACSKSDEYSVENEDGLRCMLICRTTLGNVLYNDEVNPNVESLVQLCITGPFHSVLGDPERSCGRFREFVVYEDSQVYPEFMLWYRRHYD